MKKFLEFIGEYKKYAILSPLCVLCEVAMDVFMPYIMAKIIDNGVINDAGIIYIFKIGFIMIVMAFISLIFGILAGKFSAMASMGFGKNIRKALFNKVQEFSFSNIEHFSTSSLITRITTDVVNIQNAFMMIIRGAFRSPFMLIGAITMAIITDSKLSYIFLLSIPVLSISVYIIFKIVYPRFQVLLKKYDDLNLTVQENLTGIRLVKAFVREDYEEEKFNKKARHLADLGIFTEKVVMLNMPIMQCVVYSCIIAVLWFGGKSVMLNNMNVGELSSFLVYIMQILRSLMMISIVFIMLNMSKASSDRILEVLNTKSTIKNTGGIKNLNDGSISFQNVSFSYIGKKNNLVLKDITFDIESGKTLGIIGGTGSGKSSLVQLLPRLFDITEGKLLVGGRNIKDYDLYSLRNNIGLVLQKNTLFSGTIKENLLWGNENATDEEIREACKFAEADDFIMSFPNKYDTMLGQSGVNVSGGQKQRLCIARALLKKPKILIFDDSTSAVDTATDAKIRKVLMENIPNTTKIIIAQRILSVKDADKILVLNNGVIDGIGTHNELLKNNEIYKEIYNSQQNEIKK